MDDTTYNLSWFHVVSWFCNSGRSLGYIRWRPRRPCSSSTDTLIRLCCGNKRVFWYWASLLLGWICVENQGTAARLYSYHRMQAAARDPSDLHSVEALLREFLGYESMKW